MKITKQATSKGFTLIELLVVIAIIGTLASVVLASLNSAREKARYAAAQQEMSQLFRAVELLYDSTGMYPHGSGQLCEWYGFGNELVLTGNMLEPYISNIPNDPWGNPYMWDDDYQCFADVVGCRGQDDPLWSRGVIHSGGPNGSGLNVYDSDNVVYSYCYNEVDRYDLPAP